LSYLSTLSLHDALPISAFAYTPLVSLLATWFPQRRGAVIGLLSSGVGIGMVWAGMMVPYFTELFGSQGWRYVWGLFAAVGVVVRSEEHTSELQSRENLV